MGQQPGKVGMCNRPCMRDDKGDLAELAVANQNDNDVVHSGTARISRRVSHTPSMSQLVLLKNTFPVPDALHVGAARTAINDSFLEWLESAVWIVYGVTGHTSASDEYPAAIPHELRGPGPTKEIVDELLALDEDSKREQRLRQWLVPKSAEAISTTENIKRRLNIEELAPEITMRLHQYETLLETFDISNGQLASVKNLHVTSEQVTTLADLMQLVKQSNVVFTSFVISLAGKLKLLHNCDGVRIALVYEAEDQLWYVYDDRGEGETVSLSNSGYAEVVSSNTPVVRPESVTAIARSCAPDTEKDECIAVVECFDKYEGGPDEDIFTELDLHLLNKIISLADSVLRAGRGTTQEHGGHENVGGGSVRRHGSRVSYTNLGQIDTEQFDEESADDPKSPTSLS